MFGYNSVEHYYTEASPHNKIHKLKIPVLCLSAADDPFAPFHCKLGEGTPGEGREGEEGVEGMCHNKIHKLKISVLFVWLMIDSLYGRQRGEGEEGEHRGEGMCHFTIIQRFHLSV